MLKDYRARLAAVERDIEEHGSELRANPILAAAASGTVTTEDGSGAALLGHGGLAGAAGAGGGVLSPAAALERLRAQEHNLEIFYKAALAEMSDLGQKNLAMENLKNDWNDGQRRLEDIKRRVEQLNVESAASGRVEVMDYGSRPVVPASNHRLVWAGFGGGAGMLLAVGAVAFVGLLDRRRVLDMHDATQASTSRRRGGRFPILGAIPALSAEGSTSAQVQFTAEAVHRIRARLQIQQGMSDHRTIALTSPSSGDGKTSMTVALGMSFAAAGSKTLLIEGDVVGAGLTHRLSARVHGDLACVLQEEGRLTADQVDTVRRRAREQRRPIEDVLLESGWVNEADVARAHVLQGKRKLGLLDAISGRPLSECVGPCQGQGLYVLPLGEATQADIPQVSPEAVRRLLGQARELFDTVLIDTGPILGSLEAAVMTAAADGVLLMVSRGDHRATLEAAIAELDSLHANVIGAIYNRARDGEGSVVNTSFHVSRPFGSRPQVTSRPAAALDGTSGNGSANGNGSGNGNGNGKGNGSASGNGKSHVHGGAAQVKASHAATAAPSPARAGATRGSRPGTASPGGSAAPSAVAAAPGNAAAPPQGARIGPVAAAVVTSASAARSAPGKPGTPTQK
jgi:Mrp family chromosome partitioning ATPase